MKPAGEILSFMDLLDLDEELIDTRAKNIMEKKTLTNEHLTNFIHLLQYKQLINTREDSECINNEEYNFVVNLVINVNEDNVDIVCKIIIAVLILHRSSIINKSEHLIQQILPEIYLPVSNKTLICDAETEKLKTTILQLKICNSILDAVIMSNNKMSLPFLEVPLENIIYSKFKKLQVYFLTQTVPRFFEGITGYNILDRIWNLLKQSKEDMNETALQVLCCLSNYYLPVADNTGNVLFESDVILHSEFWDLILFGLEQADVDNSLRKKSVYLTKRAIDCVLYSNKHVNITSKSTLLWNPKMKNILKNTWNDYFILIDSLEEKQSNIVLPSLKLFENVKSIGDCWLNCAFKIGLHHDNAQVRFQCLQYRLEVKIASDGEAMSVLEAINDINLFEHSTEYEPLKTKLRNILQDSDTLVNVLKSAPLIKWSPVPLYHLTAVLADINVDEFENKLNKTLLDVLNNMLKIPCNNIIIRKAVHINISHFIGNNCNKLSWKEHMNMYQQLRLDLVNIHDNPYVDFIKKNLLVLDLQQFLQLISFSHINIEFALIYFEGHDDGKFLNLINCIINRINNINSRQYSNKNECLNEAVFIVQLYKKTINKPGSLLDKINANISKVLQTILHYTSSLLISNTCFEIDKMLLLFEGVDYLIGQSKDFTQEELLIQMYKSAALLLHDKNIDIDKKILNIFIQNACLKSPGILENYKNELLELDYFIKFVMNVKFNDNINKENSGRLRNLFYEKSCEIVLISTKNCKHINNKNILDYIYSVLDKGGYGCLKWTLEIINIIIPTLLDERKIFDVTQFLHRVWNEIEELKSNSQYNTCIQQFVIILTQDTLLKRPEYNNIVVLYCNKILDYASIKNAPLYYLVKRMKQIDVSGYSHMIYILSEILLSVNVPRKDYRITENVSVKILHSSRYGINKDGIFFNSHIKVLAVAVLSKITDKDILNTITSFIIKKVDELFKSKQRYYANSHHERTLLAAMHNLLFIFLKCRTDFDGVLNWMIDFSGRIPHQHDVRTCFEWFIALYYYLKGTIINEGVLNYLKSKNLPIQSQFMILYLTITHKIKIGFCSKDEFACVMDYLHANIMGPIYGIRLYAQYLSTKVFDANEMAQAFDGQKYAYTVGIIKNTLVEAALMKDKSFMKLQNDYFVHFFDIVEDLTPSKIYWELPLLYYSSNSIIADIDFLENSLNEIDKYVTGYEDDEFYNEWKKTHRGNVPLTAISDEISQKSSKNFENSDDTRTIQKKYVPWKNMSDIDVYNNDKMKDKSDLVVVASLIDKLPNLGGMARTSEIFAVQTYVVDSIKHLQDKQFQGLSVSAERWVNVEEVRPGKPLKEYLMAKKTEGFSIVAAEQTSSSTPLQSFRFPKKSLLLLGHEKEGVPCDLLPLMDHCVEIPQQGVIRSLNVHVTAAIFIWEYARQNML